MGRGEGDGVMKFAGKKEMVRYRSVDLKDSTLDSIKARFCIFCDEGLTLVPRMHVYRHDDKVLRVLYCECDHCDRKWKEGYELFYVDEVIYDEGG